MLVVFRNLNAGVMVTTRQRYRLGIDIGGTFTDFIAVDQQTGAITTFKTLTTPDDPAVGVQTGLNEMIASSSLNPAEFGSIIHATTLITNAIIERRGVRTGLITTAGFADLLEIGREVRYSLYDLFIRMPVPLVPASLRFEVDERTLADGTASRRLDETALRQAVEKLIAQGVESIAVCFLHAYTNNTHERQAAELIAGSAPAISLSISSEVANEIREFERLSTTAANAYVQPIASAYLNRMQSVLSATDIDAPLMVMLSNGGITTTDAAVRFPVRMVESGPAAGALVAGHIGTQAGISNVLAFDMGGTTAKLCLVDNGLPTINYTLEVARVHRFRKGSGLPIQAPSVELIEIGAGGGSIAHIDALGLLAVGPQSASSDPGPACYGFGGDHPTVTDADLLLGYLDPDYFLGGDMPLDRASATQSIDQRLSTHLGMSVHDIARGIHELVNENMATAASVYIAEKARDPRQCTLVATGGAGPVHAAGVARKIGIPRVLIPPAAGVASAGGLLIAPPRMDFSNSSIALLDEINWPHINGILDNLETEGRQLLRHCDVPDADVRTSRTVDMRYVNQGHEVSVPLPDGPLTSSSVPLISQAFDAVYLELFGRTIPGVPLETITWRLSVLGPTPTLEFSGSSAASPTADPFAIRSVYFEEAGEFTDTPIYRRHLLPTGHRAQGPAIIQEAESTTVVGPSDFFSVDQSGNIVLELGASA